VKNLGRNELKKIGKKLASARTMPSQKKLPEGSGATGELLKFILK
jgi:hypothetical protein